MDYSFEQKELSGFDSTAVKSVFSFCSAGGRYDLKSSILGRFPAQPGLGGAWERSRSGPRSICTDCQPGRPILRPFREVCLNPLVTTLEEFSGFDLFIYRGEPGKAARMQFGGLIRALFAPELVGILGARSPLPARKDVWAIGSLPILSVHYRILFFNQRGPSSKLRSRLNKFTVSP